jgi:hypothetical protein
MNEEVIEDLKQFIAVTVGQSEARLRDDMVSKDDLKSEFKSLRTEMHDGFTGVGEAIANLDEHVEEHLKLVTARLDDHETRLTTLEQAA